MKALYLLLWLLFFSAAGCDPEPAPQTYSDADIARCAHVTDGFLNIVCLSNPWPTELPPATQEGLSTFGCWINDTLAFVAGDPREPARNEAFGQHFESSTGGFVLFGLKSNYELIDPREIYLRLATSSFYLGRHVPSADNTILTLRYIAGLSNPWTLDTSLSYMDILRLTDGQASGTFSLQFFRVGTTDTLRLTDGRFDVRVSTF